MAWGQLLLQHLKVEFSRLTMCSRRSFCTLGKCWLGMLAQTYDGAERVGFESLGIESSPFQVLKTGGKLSIFRVKGSVWLYRLRVYRPRIAHISPSSHVLRGLSPVSVLIACGHYYL